MMKRFSTFALAAALFAVPALLAADLANAISLPRQMPNGKVCRMLLGKVHHHHGRSGLQSSLQAAKEAALKRWVGFTVWEYGPEWGSFAYSEHKSWDCQEVRKGGWKCKVTAQPCRR